MSRSESLHSHYAKPSAIGGTLIRKVMAQFKQGMRDAPQLKLPFTEPVFIATSGGVDSMVLAHLISRYGRRIVAPELITLLHFDHQWREESGTTEKKAVRELAKNLSVKFKSVKLAAPGLKTKMGAGSSNAEEDARLKRKEEFAKIKGHVFTGHHLNDVAETLIWRFLRGEFFDQSEGILFQDHSILRPLLQVSKEEIYQYAEAEKVAFFEDPTNSQHPNLFRTFLRSELFPLLQKRFPSVQKTLAGYASLRSGGSVAALATKRSRNLNTDALGEAKEVKGALKESHAHDFSHVEHIVQSLLGAKLNRHHRTQLKTLKLNGQLSLPGGVILTRQKDGFLIKILDHFD